MNIIEIEEAASSNDIVRHYDNNLSLVWVESQTSGRGQRGNKWESERGMNLTFSLMTHPHFLLAENQFLLSKAVSLAIVNTLSTYEIEAKIKWPNDIYVGDSKICGILIECDVSGHGSLQRCVIGVGLNINQIRFVSDAPNPISMRMIKNKEFNRREVLEEFGHNFENIFMMLTEGLESPIHYRYFNELYRNDGYYQYSDAEGEFFAKIDSISYYGELVLLDKSNNKRKYQFKEVKFL